MLKDSACRSRVSRLFESVDPEVEVLVVTRPEHVYYLANYLPSPVNIGHRAPPYLIVERDRGTTLVLDGFAKLENDPAVDEVIHGPWRVAEPDVTRAHGVGRAAIEVLQKAAPAVLGAEVAVTASTVTAVAPDVRDIEPHLGLMRQVKDPDELALIRDAVRVGEAMHAASWEHIEPGMREIDAYAAILSAGLAVAEGPFVMMCEFISGPRAVTGFGQPTARRMETGDSLIMDLFPYVDGYRCDITNTITIGGDPSPEQQDAFDAVHEALVTAEAMIYPGVRAQDIYATQDEILRRANPSWGLTFHAGHALGLEHPEAPDFVPGIEGQVLEGMVIALEPGAYGTPFQGVRLEHNYLITADGLERLSNHRLSLA
jgi:Xaa-Pro aminopeptidase